MAIWGIVGNLGYGKTLLATIIAVKAAEAGAPVYANYHIKGVKYITGDEFLQITARGSSLVVLDEAYTWLESRRAASQVNVEFSRLILQSRKKHIDIVHTAQLPSTIDLRLRNVTSVLIWALRPTEDAYRYVLMSSAAAATGGISSSSSGYRAFTLPKKQAEKYYPLFNTYETVEGIDEIISPAEEIISIGSGLEKLYRTLKKYDLESAINQNLKERYRKKLEELAGEMQQYYSLRLDELE